MTDYDVYLLRLLASIRAAVGDPEGRLMQDELVEHCADIKARLDDAEEILRALAAPELIKVLNRHSEGELIGNQVEAYWGDWK